ncbi:neuronal growth regulator 1-like [Mytilus edulis]|uniref:neuronal growth regulator 1-like n=1 Tax=Mytilus edulis TaxID=6550 RepID=UPI0039EF3C2D
MYTLVSSTKEHNISKINEINTKVAHKNDTYHQFGKCIIQMIGFSSMNMWTRCAFRIVMIFEAVFLIADSSKVQYSYYTVGQTVLLKCTDGAVHLHSAVWAGPAQNSIRKRTPVSIIDMNGKRSKWNVSQYTDDGRVLSSLLHHTRLKSTGNYDLQIVNTSTLDGGLYMCYLGPIEVFSKIILKIKTLPSNLMFANATKEKILHGKENTTLHILCSVQDGIPDSLSIIRNNKTVKSDEDSSLEYILLPTRLDHGLKYTCEAWSSLLKQPLKEIIHLDIKYRPVVSSTHDGIQEIIKGTSHTLCCYVDSNPLPTSTRWMNGSQEILVTHYVTETCFILRNVSQFDQGNYTCIAYNIVGNGSVTIVTQVTSNTSSVKKSLLFPGIIILVLMITIAFITPGIALIVRKYTVFALVNVMTMTWNI